MNNEELSYIKLFFEEEKKEFLSNHFSSKKNESEVNTDNWDGDPSYLFKFIKETNINDDHILVQLDTYDHDFMPTFPTSEKIESEIKENIQRNKEILEQQNKDLIKAGAAPRKKAFLAFPESEANCKRELRREKLTESVEECLSQLLILDGIIEGSMALRNNEIKKSDEILAIGSNEDGVYTCSIDTIEDLTEDSEW